MTIREKINYLEAIETVVDFVETQMRYCMNIKRNEADEAIIGDDGDYIYEIPEDTNSYDGRRYYAMLKIKKELEKLADK